MKKFIICGLASLLALSSTAYAARTSMMRVLDQSGTATSITGTTTETQLGTCAVPILAMGANGRLEITSTWSFTNSSNNKQLRVRFGGLSGTAYSDLTATTTATAFLQTIVVAANDVNAQVGPPTALNGGHGASTGALVTSSVNTNVATSVVFTGTLSNTGETITLVSFICKVIPG